MRINLYRAKSKRFARQEKKEEPPPEQEEPPPNHIKARSFTYLIPFGDYLVFAAVPSVFVRLSALYSNQNIRYIINIIALRDRETRFFLAAVVMLAIAFFVRGFLFVYGRLANRMAYAV